LFTVEKQCSVLEVSPSGYYQWLKGQPSKRALANAELDKNVIDIFVNNKGRYGALRVFQELRGQGQMIGKNRVKRRMHALGLKALAKRKWKATTDSKHDLPIAENLLNRNWNTTGANQKWVSDVTYVWTGEGWLYLATMMDLYSRAIIGWALQEDLKTSLISDALQKALWKRKFPKGVIVHSDRGSQYCSKEYQALLKEHDLVCSMSRKGNCWDNAPMESFFHTLKTELVQFSIGFKTRDEACEAIRAYIEEYYNQKRRHSAIAYQAPCMFEYTAKCS
jgi:putative transposase